MEEGTTELLYRREVEAFLRSPASLVHWTSVTSERLLMLQEDPFEVHRGRACGTSEMTMGWDSAYGYIRHTVIAPLWVYRGGGHMGES